MRGAQVAHVDLERDWSPFRLSEGLNALCQPHPVAVLGAERVSPDFEARHSATARHYLYRVVNRRAPLTFERSCSLAVEAPPRRRGDARGGACAHRPARFLHLSRFRNARRTRRCARSTGSTSGARTTTFSSRRAPAHSCIARCARWWARWSRSGTGRWSAGEFKAAFEAADRSRAGGNPWLRPHGLYLVRVDDGEKRAKQRGFQPRRTALLSASFMRRCHPGPLDLNDFITVRSRRRLMSSFVVPSFAARALRARGQFGEDLGEGLRLRHLLFGELRRVGDVFDVGLRVTAVPLGSIGATMKKAPFLPVRRAHRDDGEGFGPERREDDHNHSAVRIDPIALNRLSRTGDTTEFTKNSSSRSAKSNPCLSRLASRSALSR